MFKGVYVFPISGFIAKPWCSTSRDDTAARVARGVCERYSESLAGENIAHNVSTLRIFLDAPSFANVRPSGDFQWRFEEARPESFEMAFLMPPSNLSSLEPEMRRTQIGQVAHSICLEMAAVRGIDHGPFDRALAHCRAFSYGYSWDGPWKNSPDRKLATRAEFSLLDSGFGEVKLCVMHKPSGAIVHSKPLRSFTSAKSFQRSARTLKWFTRDSIEFTPFITPFSQGMPHHIGVELSGERLVLDEGREPDLPQAFRN